MANKFSSASTREQVLGELAGAASACWENLEHAGIFDSNLAEFYVNEALAQIRELDGKERAEDIWTHDQYVRLEALTQAVQMHHTSGALSIHGLQVKESMIIDTANRFVNYVKTGEWAHA